MNSKPSLLFAVLLVLTTGVRATSSGVALSPVHRDLNTLPAPTEVGAIPRPATFRELPGRGLLVRTWVNDAGPFTFAIDTGAGATLLSTRVVDEAQVQSQNDRRTSIAGLSGVSVSATAATIRSLAIGDSDNYLPARGLAMITNGLPRDIDGVLDPTES